jgi:hypothetical protein
MPRTAEIEGGAAGGIGWGRSRWRPFAVRWPVGAHQTIFFAVRLTKEAQQRSLCGALFNIGHNKQFFQQFYKIQKIIK